MGMGDNTREEEGKQEEEDINTERMNENVDIVDILDKKGDLVMTDPCTGYSLLKYRADTYYVGTRVCQ